MRIVFYKSDGGLVVFFRKYNPYHDRRGRFASANGGAFLYSPGQIRYRNKKPSKQLTGPGKGDKIKSSQKRIGKNGGALRAEDMPSIRIKIGEYRQAAPGSAITKIHNFAGKGTKKELRIEKRLIAQYGGKPGQWQHTTGDVQINYQGETRAAEVHWFQEPSVGIVQPFVKRWR